MRALGARRACMRGGSEHVYALPRTCDLSCYCVPARGHQRTEGRGYGSEEL